MLPLHLLTACLFFVVAQVAGNNERHLITFNKINLGNLAALKILMHRGGYTHAHIILNGIRHVNKAVGHFDNWNDAFGHQRSPDSSTAFTTYGGRPLPEEYAGEWYESSFLGTPREPDKKSLDDLEPKKDIIYDIHQVVSTDMSDHETLNDRILQRGGKIGRVFVQHGRNTQIPGRHALSKSVPLRLGKIYTTAERIVAIGTTSITPAEISVSLSKLNFRLPSEHIRVASKDPFAANTLIRVNKMLNRDDENPALEFLPEDLREVTPDRSGSIVEPVRKLVRSGLNRSNMDVYGSLEIWVSQAIEKIKEQMIDASEDERAQLDTYLHRLNGIQLKLEYSSPKEGEAEFADAMFTVVLFTDEYKSQPFVPIGQGEASSSSRRGRGVDHARAGEVAGDSKVRTYENLPREKLLNDAFRDLPKKTELELFAVADVRKHAIACCATQQERGVHARLQKAFKRALKHALQDELQR
ncbi:hypothetical protein FA10DRAFT_262166 [Acaromyces ingoldii]|uniref:Uncharacterized protein n=1 Tax=Acaromyces ingoldii TaxID=215250 RepID=A0A316YFR8_9BASI|nr:hypothetical protein FA10DRAFT_262166 [Acaromyces ingoldii]PWN87684.1 hypothetical protein FA10DRAFT_262166 [Acaromyces ingoldii]